VQGDAAFRTAKNDLGLRPIFHQKDNRVQAHILVCFLALALWPTLEHWMHAKGMGTYARQLIKQVAGIKSMDVLPPVKRGDLVSDLRLRIVGTPEPATAQLLAHLGLRLPRDSREIGNVVPKIGGGNAQIPEGQSFRFADCGTWANLVRNVRAGSPSPRAKAKQLNCSAIQLREKDESIGGPRRPPTHTP